MATQRSLGGSKYPLKEPRGALNRAIESFEFDHIDAHADDGHALLDCD